MTIYGFARISTIDQNLQRQNDRLNEYGCTEIIEETKSGVKISEKLINLVDSLNKDDIVVVVDLDRLGRSLVNILNIVEQIKGKQAHLVCLNQNFDTTTPSGELFFSIVGAFSQFERKLIIQRTEEGRISAKNRGVKFGRKKVLNSQQISHLKDLKQEGKTVKELIDIFRISKATLYRYLNSTDNSL